MGNKLEFRDKLSAILEIAQSKQKVLDTKDIETFFAEDNLTGEQMDLVYDYLLSQKVAVKGYVKKGGTVKEGTVAKRESRLLALTEEEDAYLKIYLQELKSVKEEAPGERQAIYRQLAENPAKHIGVAVKSRLIEIYLPEVVRIARSMNHPNVFLGDLVQEGNVGLMLAIDRVIEDLTEVDFIHEIIEADIRQSMQMLIEEQTDLKKKDQRMVDQVNDINTSIKKLSEELGERISIEELSLYLEKPAEEIESVLTLAGEKIEEADD